MKYRVKFYAGEYRERQRTANADGADLYVEHHFNAGSTTANYAVVVVGSNASNKSKEFGRHYAAEIARVFETKVGGQGGILVGGYGGRGDANVKYTMMPAVLLEPLFVSNPAQAAIAKSEDGQEKLAGILAETIRKFYPHGGLIAFSIGHMGKPSKPMDTGAAVAGGGTEADLAKAVLMKAKEMLEAVEE